MTANVHIGRESAPAALSTRSLLGYGVIAGPFYVTVSLAQALTRDGFRLDEHAWSLLQNGGLSWIQITNFLLTGLMTIAAAVGLRRVLTSGRGRVWAPLLIMGYGVSMLGAGIFTADPAQGFPAGTPEAGTVSWHGVLHFAVGGVGFLCPKLGRTAAARDEFLRAAAMTRNARERTIFASRAERLA